MTIDYIYCGTCKTTTKHLQRVRDGDWECRSCRRRKNVSGEHAPVGARTDRRRGDHDTPDLLES